MPLSRMREEEISQVAAGACGGGEETPALVGGGGRGGVHKLRYLLQPLGWLPLRAAERQQGEREGCALALVRVEPDRRRAARPALGVMLRPSAAGLVAQRLSAKEWREDMLLRVGAMPTRCRAHLPVAARRRCAAGCRHAPPIGVYLQALLIQFSAIWRMRCRSAGTRGRSGTSLIARIERAVNCERVTASVRPARPGRSARADLARPRPWRHQQGRRSARPAAPRCSATFRKSPCGWLSGPSVPSSSRSTSPRIEVSGVRSSCESGGVQLALEPVGQHLAVTSWYTTTPPSHSPADERTGAKCACSERSPAAAARPRWSRCSSSRHAR